MRPDLQYSGFTVSRRTGSLACQTAWQIKAALPSPNLENTGFPIHQAKSRCCPLPSLGPAGNKIMTNKWSRQPLNWCGNQDGPVMPENQVGSSILFTGKVSLLLSAWIGVPQTPGHTAPYPTYKSGASGAEALLARQVTPRSRHIKGAGPCCFPAAWDPAASRHLFTYKETPGSP